MEHKATITTAVSYFGIGSTIQHSWFIGEVIGLNMPRLLMWVRVTRVVTPGAGRAIGTTKCVPFNNGKEIAA